MAIAFSCPRCGTRYSVEARLAGKAGRCKSCRHQMTIPRESARAPASGLFRLTPVGASAGAAVGSVGAASAGASAGMFPSSVGLAPLTEEGLAAVPGGNGKARQYSFNPALLDETDPGSTYKLAESRRVLPTAAPGGPARPPGPLSMFWRRRMRGGLKLLRHLGDLAYLATIPCALLILIAVLIDRRDLAVLGAIGVIGLSLARAGIEVLALVAGPFKECPMQGILTFIPPFTFLYLVRYPKRTRKALGRVVEPVLWTAGVVLAFVFVPGLSGAEAGEGDSVLDRTRAEVRALGGDIEAELDGRGASIGDVKAQVRDGVGQARQALDQRTAPTNP